MYGLAVSIYSLCNFLLLSLAPKGKFETRQERGRERAGQGRGGAR